MCLKGDQGNSRYRRLQCPPPMRFQSRDGDILNTIYNFDGILARRHLKDIFWPKSSWQSMERRISILFHNGYLNWPSYEHRRSKPIPEPIVWLGWKGILWIAGNHGNIVQSPISERENQLRKLDKSLRNSGIRWLREPRWIQLAHDLSVIDIKLSIEKSISKISTLLLEEWIHEGEFRSDPDVIEFVFKDRKGSARKVVKGVVPDSFFVVRNERLTQEKKPDKARFLLELDKATHSNPRFGSEKVIPGVAYIRSPEYKKRFGDNVGWWLVVTTGKIRMKNLMQQTTVKAKDDSNLFFFTTLDEVINNNVLLAPIWRQVGESGSKPLIVE